MEKDAKNPSTLKQGENLARRAIKISIIIGLICLFFAVLNTSVLLTYASGVVGLHKKIEAIQMEINSLKSK